MADARVSVLIDIRSRLAQLDRATQGFGNLLRGVVAATAAYVGVRSAYLFEIIMRRYETKSTLMNSNLNPHPSTPSRAVHFDSRKGGVL